jgi:NADPH-dependent 2,4-dienoyl-CoA reductase/sulfur reductase-like enzyme
VARTPEQFRERYDIDAHIRHRVLELDLAGQRVRVLDLEGYESRWEPYDRLLIATGAVPIRPDVPGVDAEGVYSVSTLQSGIQVRRAVDELQPKKAVIVGGGYIGLEMAEALLLRGIDVALIDMMPQVMNTLDSDMGGLVSEAVRQAGVDLYLEEALEGFDVAEGRMRAVITSARTLEADIAILGIGVRPNSDLAADAGLALGVRNAIVVNERMQTERETVWAAGDCAQTFHLVSRRPFHIALATTANRQGRVAGINLGGGYAVHRGVVGTAMTKFQDTEIARTGLQEKEIKDLGWAFVATKIKSRTRAGIYPGSASITVKMLAEQESGRLLGAQIVGGEGSAKRIDVVAAALHSGMTVAEVADFDLGYAPPFSPLWDPVVIAARQTAKQV